jgi:hypothetical protein
MYRLSPGYVSEVREGGLSVQVADTTMGTHGGLIINPLSAEDQHVGIAESLYVNLIRSITPSLTVPGTVELFPGQWFLVPPQSNVWVNAQSGGHAFTAFFTDVFTPHFPPDVVPGQPVGPHTPASGTGAVGAEAGQPPFPPFNVLGLTTVIPSYLYQQYTDDDDLQGFVDSQNTMQQDYVDTFNALNLPIYPGPIVQGALLDWVARGVYGMARPALRTGRSQSMGPLNTYGCNWLIPMWMEVGAHEAAEFALNVWDLVGPGNVVLANDDVYRRILTWHFYKADGNYFSCRFLKRRIWRFLYGKDGWSSNFAIDPAIAGEHPSPVGGYYSDPDDVFIADTRQISITLGASRNVTIRFVLGKRTVYFGAMSNGFGCNGFEVAFGKSPAWDIGTDITKMPTGIQPPAGIYLNDIETSYVPYPPLPFMYIFKEALDCGALEVPYQWNYTCHIG